tara:strand:- start:199 stop:426 length:228 start_codon:yes stop_codon:yes gene_type:complete
LTRGSYCGIILVEDKDREKGADMEIYEKNIGTTDEGEPIIRTFFVDANGHHHMVGVVEDAEVAIDDHLDTALELE